MFCQNKTKNNILPHKGSKNCNNSNLSSFVKQLKQCIPTNKPKRKQSIAKQFPSPSTTPNPLSDHTVNHLYAATIIDTKTIPAERKHLSSFCLRESSLFHHHKQHIPKQTQTYIHTIMSNNNTITIATNLNSILYQQRVNYKTT